jgi:hypothetical protein
MRALLLPLIWLADGLATVREACAAAVRQILE